MSPTQAQLISPEKRPYVQLWLIICLLLIAAMVMLGGYTRLSGSGLSITEWKPIHGSIPPMNDTEWTEEFEKYKQIPQYQQINSGMTLEEFKTIFWPEFWHRNVGRLMGIIFALPLAWFYFSKTIALSFALRLFAILGLGGLQGLMGWVMVASGLKDMVFVSHIKLAMHLGLALIIFALLLWALLDVHDYPSPFRIGNKGESPPPNLLPKGQGINARWFAMFPLLIFIQIIFGALLAGLHGGLIYNTFPLMNGVLIPPETFDFQGVWFENVGLIQFIHRWLAKFLVIVLILWWWFFRRCARLHAAKPWLFVLAGIIGVQFVLGILTLVNAVPMQLALLHQLTGLLLFAVALRVTHLLRYRAQNQ